MSLTINYKQTKLNLFKLSVTTNNLSIQLSPTLLIDDNSLLKLKLFLVLTSDWRLLTVNKTVSAMIFAEVMFSTSW